MGYCPSHESDFIFTLLFLLSLKKTYRAKYLWFFAVFFFTICFHYFYSPVFLPFVKLYTVFLPFVKIYRVFSPFCKTLQSFSLFKNCTQSFSSFVKLYTVFLPFCKTLSCAISWPSLSLVITLSTVIIITPPLFFLDWDCPDLTVPSQCPDWSWVFSPWLWFK